MFHAKVANATVLATLLGCALLAAPTPAPAADAAPAPAPALTLDEAYSRTLDRHPDLRQLALRQAVLEAEAGSAAERPPLTVGATLENAVGTGPYAGVERAELSLTLGGVLERDARRAARTAVASANLAGLDTEREARRLDLLAEVARRFLDVLAAQADAAALEATLGQRRQAVAAATRRVSAGASPASAQLLAEAALARAELDLERSRAGGESARRRLALLWGERVPGFAEARGDLFALPRVPDHDALAALLERAPELQRFAGEARLREARLQLARSAADPELGWQVGVRRLQDGGDWAVLAGVSVPLGSRTRARHGVRAAEAELAEVAVAREAGELDLRATLAEAHGRLQAEALAVERSGTRLLPLLERAEGAAATAYRAGALSQLEWLQVQSDLLAARRERITAARDFHRAHLELQRLTADPFLLPGLAGKDASP
jgi:outer membrane protein, heavy metal efflux system